VCVKFFDEKKVKERLTSGTTWTLPNWEERRQRDGSPAFLQTTIVPLTSSPTRQKAIPRALRLRQLMNYAKPVAERLDGVSLGANPAAVSSWRDRGAVGVPCSAQSNTPRVEAMSRGSVWPQSSHRCVLSDKDFFRTCPHAGRVWLGL